MEEQSVAVIMEARVGWKGVERGGKGEKGEKGEGSGESK